MKRTEKEISNEHPFAKKADVERIELAKTFSLSKYKKYEEAVKKGLNLKKIMPDIPISELKEFFKLYRKRNPND
jgi:hypothetical protein|tara:strand:- start:1333 stop:1554 length:222 start_codon:yes stop_codon:yes gene_type:complete